MEFMLKRREDTPAVGYAFVATPHSPKIGEAWCRVHENGDFQRLMGKSRRMENFGLCIMDEGLPEGHFRYMIAFDHDASKPLDPDMEAYLIRGGEYAVFHCPSMDAISDTFRRIYGEWFQGAAYEYDGDRPADFEYYTKSGAEVECDIYVPVRPKT